MIVRHRDHECRIVARDDLALKRIGETNCCGSETNRSDKNSHAERSHDLTDKRDLFFGYRNRRFRSLERTWNEPVLDSHSALFQFLAQTRRNFSGQIDRDMRALTRFPGELLN